MPPKTAAKTANGPIDNVRCPSCGHGNDYRDLNSQQLLDTGHTMSCDRCRRIMTVVAFKTVQVVVVRQATQREIDRTERVAPRASLPPPRRPSTLSPGQTRRLLKGR